MSSISERPRSIDPPQRILRRKGYVLPSLPLFVIGDIRNLPELTVHGEFDGDDGVAERLNGYILG